MEAYREAKGGDPKTARLAFQRLRRATEVMMRGPFIEELGVRSREMHMFMREFPMILDHYLRRFERKAKRRPSKKKSDDTEAASE